MPTSNASSGGIGLKLILAISVKGVVQPPVDSAIEALAGAGVLFAWAAGRNEAVELGGFVEAAPLTVLLAGFAAGVLAPPLPIPPLPLM